MGVWIRSSPCVENNRRANINITGCISLIKRYRGIVNKSPPPLRPRAYFLVNLGIWKIRPCAYFLEKFRRIWVSVYLRFSFNILVRIYPVKTPFSQNFPAARADRPCAYFFEIFTFRKSRCAFISFQKSPESGSVRLLRGGAFIYNTPVVAPKAHLRKRQDVGYYFLVCTRCVCVVCDLL